jgi:hypothetical protein
MGLRDDLCLRPWNGRVTFCLLLSLLISTIILFLFTYQKYGLLIPNAVFDLYQRPTSTSREVTIQLHPEEHVRRSTTTLTHHWNITKGYRSPDGVRKLVYLINGKVAHPES